MTGHVTGPHSQGEPRSVTAEQIAAERAAVSTQRSNSQPVTQHAAFRAARSRLLGRRLNMHIQNRGPVPRHPSPLGQRTSNPNAPSADSAPVEAKRPPTEAHAVSPTRLMLHILNRAGRLTFDAVLLIVFAPVIAVWLLNERRKKH